MSLHCYTSVGAESELCCAGPWKRRRRRSRKRKRISSGWTQLTYYFISLWGICKVVCTVVFDWRYPTSSSHHMRVIQHDSSHAGCIVRNCCAKKMYKISNDWLLADRVRWTHPHPAVGKRDKKNHFRSLYLSLSLRWYLLPAAAAWQSTVTAADDVPDFLCLI